MPLLMDMGRQPTILAAGLSSAGDLKVSDYQHLRRSLAGRPQASGPIISRMSYPRIFALAQEMLDAYAAGRSIAVPPSAREGGCDLDTGYAVEAELTRIRRAGGRRTVGRKIGLANRAVWRALKMKTLVWANMYDDTVHHAARGDATLSLARMRAPRLEPEIVVKLRTAPVGGPSSQRRPAGSQSDLALLQPGVDAVGALEAVDWYALAFELVDCPFPDWRFQPGDFMASLGLHAALIVGEPRPVQRDAIPQLVDQLGTFTVKLSKNGEVVHEGGGKNVLDNPALCLVEFASAVPAQAGAEPLRPGELISTGSLTTAPPVAPGERWSVVADGLDVPPLSLRLTA